MKKRYMPALCLSRGFSHTHTPTHSRTLLSILTLSLLLGFFFSGAPPAEAASIDLVTNGQAEQTTDYNASYLAGNGINNNTGDFTHTHNSDPGPAVWQVLITNGTYSITNLVIYNRPANHSRLRDITIEIVEFDGDVATDFTLGTGGTVSVNTYTELGDYINPGNNGQNDTGVTVVDGNNPSRLEIDFVTMTGGPVVGNLIRIARTADGTGDEGRVLSLAEVYAYGDVYVAGVLWSDPSATNELPTSADVSATLDVEGDSNAVSWLYWDTTDKDENFTWGYTNSLGTVSTGLVERTISNLTQGTTYYARFYGTNSTVTNAGWSDAICFTTEQVIANNDATLVTTTSATFNATLYTEFTNYYVSVYWGLSNGGTNASSWGNTNYVGAWTNKASTNLTFSTTILSDSTPYYYAFRATNSTYDFWAQPSTRLDTDGRPAVENAGFTPEKGYATLSGNVISTGGAPTTVRIYWGEVDAGTNFPTAWANTNIISGNQTEGVPFFSDTTNDLVYGVQYYYRAYAANSNGAAWASSTAGFVTAPEDAFVAGPYNWDFWDGSGQSNDWVVLNGNAWYLSSNGGGVDSANSGGTGHSGDGGHPTFLFESPVFKFNGGTVNGTHTIRFSMSTGAGDQTGGGPDFATPAAVVAYNGGDANSTGEKGLAFYNLDTLVYDAVYFHCCDNNGTETFELTAADLTAAGVDLSATYALNYYDNDSGSWGWTVLNWIDISADLLASSPISITNLPVSTDYTSTSATFNATFDGTESLFKVYACWGTNDGETATGAWDNVELVGTYTNVGTTNLEFYTEGLIEGTVYEYTFMAANAATNMWAQPNATFQTVGSPKVDNGIGATPNIGYATLNGELIGGSKADIYVYWGPTDGTNNPAAWANTNTLQVFANGPFATSTSETLIYGLTYYYRCYAVNAFGDDWADSTINFTTLYPGEMTVTNNLEAWYDASTLALGDGDPVVAWSDLSGNGRHLDSYQGSPTFKADAVNGLPAINFDNASLNMVVQDKYFAKDVYVVFRSAYDHRFGPDWGAPIGVPDGDDADRTWMLQGNEDRFWDSELPSAVKWNGIEVTSANNFDMSAPSGNASMGDYMVLKVEAGPNNGIQTRDMIVGSRTDAWQNSKFDTAEVLAYNTTLSSEDENTLSAYLAWKYGISTSYAALSVPSMVNNHVSDLAPDEAQLNGTLAATGAVYDVWVYWSTSDGTNSKTAWLAGSGDSQYMGSFTNVTSTDLSHLAQSLTASTTYYYTFYASNMLQEIWAQPSESFGSLGAPTVDNNVGATGLGASEATLNGELTAGGTASVYVCWGYINGGTGATGSWQNVEPLGSVFALEPFSTNITGTLFGIPYYYTCFVTNSSGGDWSPVTNFTTLSPIELLVTDGLTAHYDAGQGITTDGSGVLTWVDQSGSNLVATRTAGTLTLVENAVNGLPVVNFADSTYANITGNLYSRQQYFVFSLPNIGDWGSVLGSQVQSGYLLNKGGYMWDQNYPDAVRQNGGAELSPNFQLSNIGEFMVVRVTGNDNDTSVRSGWALGRQQGWGRLSMNLAEVISYDTTLSASDEDLVGGYLAAKYGITTSYPVLEYPFVENTGITGLLPGEAELNGTLQATQSVYDVWVYWSTNNGVESKAAWLAQGDSQYMGSFTNVGSTALVHSVTGLPLSTTHYYNYYASNHVEEIWGDSYVFGSAGPPTVENVGGAIVGVGTATLQGELVSGGLADIYVCWGNENPVAEDTSAWQNVEYLGTNLSGIGFSTNITDAYYGITYYYRCYATNSQGSDWADSSTNFVTMGPLLSGSLIWDFESGDYTGWTQVPVGAAGNDDTAFEPGRNPNSRENRNQQGDYHVTTRNLSNPTSDSDNYEGIIETDSFYISQPGEIKFLIGGGNNTLFSGDPDSIPDNVAAVTLERQVSPGDWEMVLTEDGNNQWNLWEQTWDTTPYVGDTMRLRIYDTREGSWGFVEADYFRLTGAGFDTYLTLTNTPPSDLASGQAQLNATLNASGAVYHVWAYWSTNDHTTNAASWMADGTGSYVGSFTNVVGQDLNLVASGLPASTTYYYAFRATNQSEEIWGEPSMNFETMGTPTVDNNGGATNEGIGTAELRGELTAGGAADIYVCWGKSKGGTSTGAWEHVESLGQRLELQAFSTSIGGTYYGVTYYYRCYATNNFGVDWADSATNFMTLVPESGVEEGISFLAIDGDDTSEISSNKTYTHAIDFGTQPAGRGIATINGVVFADGNPGAFPGTGGGASHTIGTGSTTLPTDHIGDDGADAYLVDGGMEDLVGDMTYDNSAGEILLTGLTPGQPYQFRLYHRVWGGDRRQSIEFDTDGVPGVPEHTGVFHEDDATYPDANLPTATQVNALTYTYTLSPGVTTLTVYIDLVSGGTYHMYGLTNEELPVDSALGIINQPATTVLAYSADLVGTLDATQSVFTVSVYWSTNENTNAAAWLGDPTASNALIGTYTNVGGQSLTNALSNLTRGETYYYTFVATNAATNMWATPTASFTTDGTAPSPNPMGFAAVPAAIDESRTVMTASNATDVLNNPVQYFFQNTSNLVDSGWISSTVWTNTDLVNGTTYGYWVKARDAVSNETARSAEFTATPVPDVIVPTPSPMLFVVDPYPAATGLMVMEATNAFDLNGPVVYLFENTTNGVDSGWITSTVWTNTGVTNGVTYGYRVRARDAVLNQTDWSTIVSATARDAFPTNSGTGGAPSPLAGTTNPATGVTWAIGDTYHLVFVSSTVTNLSNRDNVHFWNDYVNTLAHASSLPGFSNLTWKVIGADTDNDARDNALVSGPVYLVDATTKVADDYADMWNESVDVAINVDEHGNAATGDTHVWSGANATGTSGGGNSLNGSGTAARSGRWNEYANRNWIYRDDPAKSGNYRFYGLSQPIMITAGGADTNPPLPATMTWADPPQGLTSNTIAMKATLAYDLVSAPVEYFFTNTVTHDVRDWDASRAWIDAVAVNSLNTYRAKARDAVGNETEWSAPYSATPVLKGTGGIVAPGGLHPVSGEPWQVGDIYQLAFVSSTVTNMSSRNDIHFWNEYVNTVASGSALPGVSNLTWKVIGSDTDHHAKDNALVTAPVFLMDASTMIAVNYAYMWNGSIDAALNMDENGDPGSGSGDVWTGSGNNGTSSGSSSLDGSSANARRGERAQVNGNWMSRDDKNRTEEKHLYALSQPIRIASGAADTNSPVPSTMTWADVPNGLTTNTISMKATLAYDLDSPAVEYFFTNTVTHEIRNWDADRTWVNTVAANSVNTYMVKARDAVGNETAWSASHSATPLLKGPNGLVAPTGMHPTNGVPWQAGDIYHLAYVSSTTVNMTDRYDIHYWNEYMNTLSAASGLPGVPNLTWKVIGSDTAHHARDNALVTAPVYLMDATTKIADGYAYIWNGSIDNTLNIDENGNDGAGDVGVWTGTGSTGTSGGSRSFDGTDATYCRRGERTQKTSQWIHRDDKNRSENKHLYGLSQPIRIASGAADTNSPLPNTMTWADVPNGVTTNTISMKATLAYDLDSPGIEYFLTNTVTHEIRDWDADRTWVNTVAANSVNTYMVKARDAVGNETEWSAPYEATPLLKGPGGLAAPTGIHPTNGVPWQAGDVYHFAFVSSTVTNMSARENIHFWNDYVKSLAEGSSLPGLPDLTWKNIGSDTDHHAKDNALVTAPVYLLDATTKIADGYVYMWNGSIDNTLNIDENGNAGSGDSGVWTGSGNNGTSAGSRSFDGTDATYCRRGERTYTTSWWLHRDDKNRAENKHVYALSQPIRIVSGAADTNAPSPNPMTFAILPAGVTTTSIHMRATLAYDLDSPVIEYLFTNTTTHAISGWQSSPDWTNVVTLGWPNTYMVKARDSVGNETDWSDPYTTKPLLPGPNGIITPLGINPLTGEFWKGGETYHLAFVTSTTDDLNPAQDIAAWNAYVNTVADASSISGVPDVNWKIIGSTEEIDARDNALVSAPVYLLDAATKIADSYTDMWDTQLDAPLNIDENGDPGSGSADAWTGTTSSGTKHSTYTLNGSNGNASRGDRTYSTAWWIYRDTQNRSGSRHFYALSEPLTIAYMAVNVVNDEAVNIGAGTADLVGTVYAPLGQELDVTLYWSTSNNVGSEAWLADGTASNMFVGSYTNIVGQSITGSVGSLTSDVIYYYTLFGSNADVSVWASSNAQFAIDTDGPTPDPMSFAVLPEPKGAEEIRMTAVTATDTLSLPVEYYFENTSNLVNSGWISSPSWSNTGLVTDTTYGYRVQARDAVGNTNGWSAVATATTGIPWNGLVAYWSFDDADVSGTTILDLADDTGDGKGDHDATIRLGVRPSTDLPGDPDGGLIGNYFDANYNGNAVVDTFGGSATHSNLNAGEQLTVAGWFRELPDGNEDAYISKEGDSVGWDIRRNGSGNSIRIDLRSTSGGDGSSGYTITNSTSSGPWYFLVLNYTRDSETNSTLRFYAADSGAADKGLNQVGGDQVHNPDNDVSDTGSMVVFGARDSSNNDTNSPTFDRHSGAKMDEIAIWNRGLTLDEVTAWYGLSYFSGLKANAAAIQVLLNGAVGTTVNGVGPHGHNWERISNAGTAGDISGSIVAGDALIQITATDALQFSVAGVGDDNASTDEKTPISITVLNNDEIDGGLGNAAELEITMVTQPAEGVVTIDGGSQSLTFDPSGSAVLRDLLAGETSVQTFDYTARNTNTLTTGTGTVTVTVSGLASFDGALVAHWTFDDADVTGQTVYDVADDAGDGNGDHDATLYGGTRPGSDLPGDPNGGLVGNYFNANGNDYGVVDTFGGAATHSDLEAGEQFTVAGWFRERPDGNEDAYISKEGNTYGWDLRRNGSGNSIRTDLRGTSGADNPTAYNITDENDGGPWYFMAVTYTKESDSYSAHRFYAADSGDADKGLNQIGGTVAHSTDNDASDTGSMVVFAARDNSNQDTTPPALDRHSNTKMDDIAFWSRGLSMEEVTAWYGLSYFSGLKATNAAIVTLLDGAVGISVTNVGPHGHNWTKVSTNGTAGDISGSVSNVDAVVQITASEALQLSLLDVVADDAAVTDEKTAISISVLLNDKIDGDLGNGGALEIIATTQPSEGDVSINGGSQALTFDPSGSAVLRDLLVGEVSVQTFDYTARNTNTLTTGTGTVTVTVSGFASFGDALVAHWTFDDTDVSGESVRDVADDAGFGKGDHDATLYGGTRPSTDLPGDPDGGLVGNYFDGNGNDYGVVDTFGGAATHDDLEANDQFTVAGWFRERGDENQAVYVSKYGEGSLGWDIRRNGDSAQIITYLRGTDGGDNSSGFTILDDPDDGPWYFVAMTYTKDNEYYSTRRFYAADSGATDKGLNQVGGADVHSTDNDVASSDSMVVFGAYDTSNNDTTGPSIGRASSTRMDDIAVWNRGLTIEEVTAWYGLGYFSGLKATNAAIATLLDGTVGTAVTNVGPHGHNWTKISTNGTAGDISGSVSNENALVQVTATEALQISLPDVVKGDDAATDDETAISILVLNNDKIDGGAGGLGALAIIAITQPAEGIVTIDGDSQSLTFDPSSSTVLRGLLVGETSVQTFDYRAQNTNTLTEGTGTVTVTVSGLASFGDALVAHWTFDDADVSGQTAHDIADDVGFGKGDHDATLYGGTRPDSDLPGDPDGGLVGNYFDANGNDYGVVDTFAGAATHSDLDANDQFTMAGWFRELPDENHGVIISKYGDGNVGWDLRRNGTSSQVLSYLWGTDGGDNSSGFTMVNDLDDGPWYFMAITYTKGSEYYSTLRFFAADSSAADKGINQVGGDGVHSPDNDAATTGSMLVFGAYDTSNNDTTGPSIGRAGSVRMDDIAFWNRGLSKAEVTAWYGLSYFSGLKATDTAMTTLLDGTVGASVTNVGPHGHNWTKISTNGTAGDISGSVSNVDAIVQITATEALQLSLPDVVADDGAATDDETPISISVLLNDKIDGDLGSDGALEITVVTQPVEGTVNIDSGSQSLTFDPTGSTVLHDLLAGETSVQTFDYTARNTNTLTTGTGTVTVTVSGLASFGDGLVAHWTFDDAHISGQTVLDIADDAGFGKGDHDATLYGGTRPAGDLPGDPDGGLIGNYFDANNNDYAVVDTFGGAASHSDLDAGDQFTVAGWFRELGDENKAVYVSKHGDSVGWDLRRQDTFSNIYGDVRGTDGTDNTSGFTIENDLDDGPWYFLAMTYTKDGEYYSTLRYYAADSEAADKGINQIGGVGVHSPDNDAADTGSMVVLGAYDTSNNDTTGPSISRAGSVRMDDIAFWNRGLSMEEVTAWYGLGYFSGLKATNDAMMTLLDGAVGTVVTNVGPHGHNWSKISTNGTAGDVTGSVLAEDALVQITATEALKFSLPDMVGDDSAVTDEGTVISISVLLNDKIDGELGSAGALEITVVTQPAEGTVSIDGGSQSLTFDPSGSTVLSNLLAGETSVQTFDYTARNVNTLSTDIGTVTVTVSGLASFSDALVAHWTFDDTNVIGSIIQDVADDGGFGKGDHDATMYGGTRTNSNLPGDPDGGPVGSYFDANGNGYAVVDTFAGAASHSDLDAGDQFTVAGWFRERPDGSEEPYISKQGDVGWDLRRYNTQNSIISYVRGTDGTDNSSAFSITSDDDGGPWYFMAVTYTKDNEYHSTVRYYAADSGAADKGIGIVGNPQSHSPDNDASETGSMVVFGARDNSNNHNTSPGIDRHSSTKMDDIAIWNRGLSLEEVTAWYGLSYFSGLKATNAAIDALLDGPIGTLVVDVGPHEHDWRKIANAGTAGDISGSVLEEDALIQITATEALEQTHPAAPTVIILR